MPIWLLTLWPRLKPLLPYLAGVVLLVAACVWAHHRGVEAQRAKDAPVISGLQQTIADVRAKTAQAQADDLANKTRVETAQVTVTEKSNASLESALADARARADDLTRRLRTASAADPGGGGGQTVPGAPDAAQGADGAGGAAELATAANDNRICAENTVKASAWRDWWTEQTRIVR